MHGACRREAAEFSRVITRISCQCSLSIFDKLKGGPQIREMPVLCTCNV